MKNSRLQLFLDASGLSLEDRENISRIFAVLSYERQAHILSDWENYIFRFSTIRSQIMEEETRRLLAGLSAIEQIIDEAVLRENERIIEKETHKKNTRQELEASITYDQIQQLKKIKNLK